MPSPTLADKLRSRGLRLTAQRQLVLDAVYRLGHRAFFDRVKLAWAGSDKPKAASQWRTLLTLAESWTAPPFPLTGEDAMAAGAPEGPLVGQSLREVEDWWVDEDFPADAGLARQRLAAVIQGMAP